MTRSLSIRDPGCAGRSPPTAGSNRSPGAAHIPSRGLSARHSAGYPRRLRRHLGGITLIELLVAVALLIAVSAIAIPTYQGYMDEVNVNNVRKDFALIEVHIERFRTENGGSLPDSLNQTAATTLTDPWGRPYQYLNIEEATGPGLGKVRKDKNLVPLNTDFDLYSMGKDGESKSPLTAAASHDDVVRANNGAYVGLASDY